MFRAKLRHALTRVKTIQRYGTWNLMSPGRRTLVYLTEEENRDKVKRNLLY